MATHVSQRASLAGLSVAFSGIFHSGNLVAEAANVGEGLACIEATRPDLRLLDIQLPDGDGFSLLEQLKFMPEVIFTTAFDQYAVRAFNVNALD